MMYLPLPYVLQVFGRPSMRLPDVGPATLLVARTATAMATIANANAIFLIMLYVPPWSADPASRRC